jgi:hypothetical protein
MSIGVLAISLEMPQQWVFRSQARHSLLESLFVNLSPFPILQIQTYIALVKGEFN